MNHATPEQKKAALNMIFSIAEAIRALKSVPSGHLYAQLMGQVTLEQYQSIIGILKDAGVVTEKGHFLTWTEAEAPVEVKHAP